MDAACVALFFAGFAIGGGLGFVANRIIEDFRDASTDTDGGDQ